MVRILILDDDATIRFAMSDFFGIKGFAVDCAATIDDARQLVEQHLPQVVISDLRLSPTGDEEGLGFVSWLGTRFPSIAAIVISAYGSLASEKAARQYGARAFLHKPQPMAVLLSTIEELLAEAEPARVRAGRQVAMPRPPEPGRAGDELVEAVWHDLLQQVSRRRVGEIVREVSAELAGSRVPAFVPVFVRRLATERLRRELGAASRHPGAPPTPPVIQRKDRHSC